MTVRKNRKLKPPPASLAVVTGAGSGIGRAFVDHFTRQGLRCLAVDVDEAGLAAWEQVPAFQSLGSMTQVCDVSFPDDVNSVADRAFSAGPVVKAVHCAGVLRTGLAWQMTTAQWRKVIDVNLFGSVHVMQAFVPPMLRQQHGSIIQIASMAALTAGAGVAAYSASKHGVLALCESTARELAALGSPVTVHVVCPGAVKTGITRNLGDRAGSTDSTVEQLDAHLDQLIESGMPPEELVEITLAAVASGSFGIFPHDYVRDSARRRTDTLLAGAL